MENRLLSHYNRAHDGAYLLEITFKTIDEFFNPHDPSPIHRRDLNPKIVEMILSQIIVFPKEFPVRLKIHLPKKLKKLDYEEKLATAIRHYFEYEYLDAHLHLKRRVRKGSRTFMVASIIFISCISLSFLLDNFFPGKVLAHILSQGFFVGGWVSLWHPVDTLLYEWLPLEEEKKKFHRLLNMEIDFSYY